MIIQSTSLATFMAFVAFLMVTLFGGALGYMIGRLDGQKVGHRAAYNMLHEKTLDAYVKEKYPELWIKWNAPSNPEEKSE